MDTAKLKGLQVRKSQIEAELKALSENASEFNKKIEEKSSALQKINRELQELQEREPIVTEHALLRYVERVMKVDLNEIRKEILSEANKEYIKKFGNCKIPVECKFGKYKLVVRNKSVITIEDIV